MNAITLSGTIHTKDITLRETPNKMLVTSFILKVPRDHKETEGEKFDYITVVCWNGLAKRVTDQYEFGMTVEVKGAVRTSRRKLKEYKVFNKNGEELPDFQIPVSEVYAQRVDKLA